MIVKKIIHIFLLLTLPQITVHGQDLDDISLDDLDEQSSQKIVTGMDEETGLENDDYSITNDQHRLSLLYHFNRDISSLTDLQTFEGQYAFNLQDLWVEVFFMRVSALYSEVFDTTSIALDQGQSSDSIQAFGAALSLQSFWIQELINNKRLFTTTSAGLGYYSYSNNFTGLDYTGFGLKTDFGVHIRQSSTFHYGVKMSYNLVPLKREAAFEGEPSSSRSLTASWLSLGFDLSIYF